MTRRTPRQKTPRLVVTIPKTPKAPKTYNDFVERFPKLAAGWDVPTTAGAEGPLDEVTVRLMKLAIAIGG